MFVELTGLAAGLRQCRGNEMDVILIFSEVDSALERGGVGPSQFALNCTPAVNLFEKRADRKIGPEGTTSLL